MEVTLENKVATYVRVLEIRIEVLEKSIAELETNGAFKFLVDEKKAKLQAVVEVLEEVRKFLK